MSNRSPRATSSRDSQHTSGSSHSQTKTWWHRPRHDPPRPLQAQPDLLQSLRDGFGEYILVKGTRRGGHMSEGHMSEGHVERAQGSYDVCGTPGTTAAATACSLLS